ncbi:aldo/keto reductase [Micromonospora echinofusca]|uniref:aldo/keto reductase n=1 Tax=Micromonospora echinofusca TaxID=47858 RepID=UPI000C7108DB
MEFHQLGRSGLRVSTVTLGTFNFGGPTDEAAAEEIIHTALDAGVNLVDTANAYQDGRSEQILGKAIRHRRDDVLIATKCYNEVGPGPNDWGNSAYAIKRECERSLRRLGVDHIDIFHLHRHDLRTPVEETLGALTDLVRDGKVRYIGTSTMPSPEEMAEQAGLGVVPTWRLVEMAVLARGSLGVPGPVAEQSPYNLLEREVERDILPICREYGVGFVAYSPLAMGYLSERFLGEPPAAARFTEWWSPRGAIWEPVQRALAALLDLAAEHGQSLPEFAHSWLSGNRDVTSTIIGPRTLEQLTLALKATGTTVDAQARQAVDAIVAPGSSLWFRTIEQGHRGTRDSEES